MSTDDEIKAAEKRGYSAGYHAGRRKRAAIASQEREHRQRQAMADRIYLALLPVAMTVEGWSVNGEKITGGDQRIRLASLWAEQAMRWRPAV